MWVYCQARMKGTSPKLTTQLMGPCEVLEQLSVYQVKLCVLVADDGDCLATYCHSKPSHLTQYHSTDNPTTDCYGWGG